MGAEPRFWSKEGTYAVGTTVAACDTIDLRNARGARVFIPSGSSVTSLTPNESYLDSEGADDDSDWFTCGDSDAVMTVAAGNSYAIPDSLFGVGQLRLVADVAGEVYITRKG